MRRDFVDYYNWLLDLTEPALNIINKTFVCLLVISVTILLLPVAVVMFIASFLLPDNYWK